MDKNVDVLATIRHQAGQMETASLRKIGVSLKPARAKAIADQLRAVEDAVAELIAAARKVAAVEHPPVTEENAKLLYEIQGLRAALARVGGAK